MGSDSFLEKRKIFVHNSIIRAKLRELIENYAQSAFEAGEGPDGFGRFS